MINKLFSRIINCSNYLLMPLSKIKILIKLKCILKMGYFRKVATIIEKGELQMAVPSEIIKKSFHEIRNNYIF